MKLAGRMSSKPLNLPGKHLINSSLLGANALTMAGFLTMSSSTPLLAGSYLGASTALSFIKGYTTTAAIGGADMRQYYDILSRELKLTHRFSGRYYCIKCLLVRPTISQ
jgi:NAD(P) transhydrogenase